MRASLALLALSLAGVAPASAFASDAAADKKTIKRIVRQIERVPSLYAKGDPPVKFKSLPPFSARKLAPFVADKKRLMDRERDIWLANKESYTRANPLRAAIFAAAAAVNDLQGLKVPLTLEAAALPRELFQNGRVKYPALVEWNFGCICESGGKTGIFPVHDELFAMASKARAPLLQMQVPAAAATFKLEQVRRQMQDAAEARTREMSKGWQAAFDFALARVEGNLVFLYEYNYLLGQIRADQLPELAKDQAGWTTVPRLKIGVRETLAKALAKDRAKLLQKIQNDYPDTPWAYVAERESRRPLGMAWSATQQ